jgi:hypothetical protein
VRRPEATDHYQSMTENQLKHLVLDLAYRNGWAVFHLPATNIRGSQGRGYPDLTFARDGEVMWMELKQEDGKASIEQWAWGIALGGRWHLIRPSDWHSGRVAELLA